MLMNEDANINRSGFTLVELMLTVVAAAIVMFGASQLVTAAWRSHHRFMSQEITMNEIRLLEAAFLKEAREKGSSTSLDVAYQDTITFYSGSGNTTSFVYDSTNHSINFMQEDGSVMEMLQQSVVSGFRVVPVPDSAAVTMVVEIQENELGGKQNIYSITSRVR